jgi:acyl-CoA thioester hydrolase
MKKQNPYSYFHIFPLQIRFNDFDNLGHANNSVYQQYFDLGRVAYFNDVLKVQMDWKDEGLILVSISIDFQNPIKLYENAIVQTKVYHLGNKSLKMSQEIINQTTGKIAASSKSTMVGYSNNIESSIPIPERWRKLIISYEHDILFEV